MAYGLLNINYVCHYILIIYDIWITNDIVYEIIYKIENDMAFLFRWIFFGMILFYAKWIIFYEQCMDFSYMNKYETWVNEIWNMMESIMHYLNEWDNK